MPDAERVTPEVVVWHDEADRLAVWGCLDPVDGCMCRDCVLSPAEPEAAVQYGVRLLVPHVNAGETVWFPDRWYAEKSLTPGLGELTTRVAPPGE